MREVLYSLAAAVLLLPVFAERSDAQIRIQTATLSGGAGFTQDGSFRIGVTTGQVFIGVANDKLNAGASGFWYTTLEEITVVSSTVEQLGEEIPVKYELRQNYPNPFNPTTRIKYGLPESARVRVTIYNVLGQLVSTIMNKDQAAGYYELNWDARTDAGATLPSGLYFYRVETKNFSATRSMIFQK